MKQTLKSDTCLERVANYRVSVSGYGLEMSEKLVHILFFARNHKISARLHEIFDQNITDFGVFWRCDLGNLRHSIKDHGFRYGC